MRAPLVSSGLTQRKAPRPCAWTLIVAATLGVTVRLATAAEEQSSTEPQIDFTAFGPGVWSCATWLATPAQERDGANWILGFFTAANLSGEDDRDVGGKTGSSEIVTEVKAKCADEPKMRMGEATARVYKELQRAGK